VLQSWLRLSVRAGAADLDAVSNFLIERGSPGVVVKRNGIEAYFPCSPANAPLKRAVRRYLRDIGRLDGHRRKLSARWKVIKEENWHDSWRRFIKAQKVGRSFWVTPPWLPPPKNNRREVITIEPGMAFGTGTHTTTRGCLEFLEKVAVCFRGKDFAALDVGTGSGILAIALSKLRARSIWAIDNDPVALKIARENLSFNGVEKNVHLSGAELSRIRKSFSLVVANLTAETILGLADALAQKVAPRGFLILSGILHEQSRAVTRRFGTEGFVLLRRKREKEWVTLLLKRK
jgi:ribosomal protein L11 methyltransferase